MFPAIRKAMLLVMVMSLLLVVPGTASAISSAPASLDFGDVPVNTTATGTVAVTVDAGYQVSGAYMPAAPGFGVDYSACLYLVAPGTCNVTLRYAATSVGRVSGTMTLLERPIGGTDELGVPIALTANAVRTYSADPARLEFGDVPLNTTATRTVTVTVDAGYQVSGAYMPAKPGFSVDYTPCLYLVAPGTCTVSVRYAPTAIGAVSDTMTLFERPLGGAQEIGVTIGLAANVVSSHAADPASLDFGSVPLNSTVNKSVAIRIDAGYRFNTAVMPANHDFGVDFWTCPAYVGPGTCLVIVSYTPTTLGAVTDTLTTTERALVGTDIRDLTVGLAAKGVENTPPTTTATAVSGSTPYSFGSWATADVVVSLAATDNPGGSGVARTEYRLDGGAWTPYVTPFGVAAEGVSSLRFRSIDNVGNVEIAQDAVIRIDSTAPTGSISIDSGATFTRSTSVTLGLGADDGTGSGVSKMRLANTSEGLSSAVWEDLASTHAYTLPSGDGTKTVFVQFQDAVGNVSSTYSDTIALDSTRPMVSATVASGTSGANGWYTSSVTVRFACADGGSGIPAGACPADEVLSAEGSSVSSTARTVTDAAGMTSDPSNVVTVRIDTTAPSVSIADPKPDDAVQDTFTFGASLSDAVSGPGSLSFSVRSDDGSANGRPIGFENLAATKIATSGSQATFRLAFDTTKLPDGYYLLLARGSDTAGNSASGSATFNHVRIVNLALVKLLPSTDNNKAGRTMPVKFTIRESSSRTFVENQQLTITIREKGSSTILQRSTYGTGATAYRIDRAAESYITNFQTRKSPTSYVVEVWRQTATVPLLVGSFEFRTLR